MKIAVFWVVAPCSLVEPDDGGSKDLWNVGKLLPDYTVLQPRRQQSELNYIFGLNIYINNIWFVGLGVCAIWEQVFEFSRKPFFIITFSYSFYE
jgi:hypothetical protein